MKIGIIAAMEKELDALLALLNHVTVKQVGPGCFYEGTMGENTLVLHQCGIGKANSAAGAAAMLLEYSPDVVISTGVAGGADSTLQVGDVVVASECRYHDVYCGSDCEYGQFSGMPAFYPSDELLIKKAQEMVDRYPIRIGLTVSGDWFVDSKDKIRNILSHFPKAKAVDMESCSIAQVCHTYNVPFVSFRIISDVPLNDTKASQYFDFWNRISKSSFEVTKSYLNMF